jgi:iron(III) transport system permease protein
MKRLDAVAVAIGAAFAIPFAYLISRAARDLHGTWDVLSSGTAVGPLWRTIQLAVLVSLVCCVIGTTMAWLVERTDLPGRRVWRIVLPLPLVIPSFLGAAALLNAFNTGGLLDEVMGIRSLPNLRGLGGATVVLSALSYPYVFLPVAARMRGLSPSLEESARLLGRNERQVFREVVVPQIAPATTAGVVLVFLYAISDFGGVQIVRYDTLTRSIYESSLLDRTTANALGLLLGVIALIVSVGERRLAFGFAMPAVARTRPPRPVALGRWKVPAMGVTSLIGAFGLGGPMAVLTWWVVRGARNGQSLTGRDSLGTAIRGSLVIGLLAAVVAVAVVLPIAYAGRRRSRASGIASAIVTAGFALPGLVIALAMVTWSIGTPLYQSLTLLVMAHTAHFGAQALRASQVAVDAVPVSYDEAAQLLGAHRVRRFVRIDLPLLVPGLTAAGGLVLLSVVKELPMTLLLRPLDLEPLSLWVWDAAQNASFTRLGFAGLVLVALSGVLSAALVMRPAVRSR